MTERRKGKIVGVRTPESFSKLPYTFVVDPNEILTPALRNNLQIALIEGTPHAKQIGVRRGLSTKTIETELYSTRRSNSVSLNKKVEDITGIRPSGFLESILILQMAGLIKIVAKE